MADLKLEIPIVGNTPNTAIDKNIVEKIKREYGNDIKEVSDITNVPEQLITSVIYVESKGDATATNSRTIGLMQLDPITAVSCIVLEITKDRLSQKEKDILGITDTKLFDNIIKLGKGVDMKAYQNSFIPASALVKPMLLNKKKNILLGAIYLKQIIDSLGNSNILRIDRIITAYNTGTAVLKKDWFKKNTPEQMLASVNNITKNYILAIGGKNGLMDGIA